MKLYHYEMSMNTKFTKVDEPTVIDQREIKFAMQVLPPFAGQAMRQLKNNYLHMK